MRKRAASAAFFLFFWFFRPQGVDESGKIVHTKQAVKK